MIAEVGMRFICRIFFSFSFFMMNEFKRFIIMINRSIKMDNANNEKRHIQGVKDKEGRFF